MPSIKGDDLSMPLTNQLFIQFTALLDQEHKECSKVAQKLIEMAKEQGEQFSQSLYQQEKIKFYL